MAAAATLRRRSILVGISIVASVVAGSCGQDTTGPGVRAAPAAILMAAGNEQVGAAGEELPAPLVVQVLDAQGNPVEGQLVNFRVTSGGGSVFAGAAITDDVGMAQERWTLGQRVSADTQAVEARAVNTSSGAAIVFATFRATAVAGAPDTMIIVSGNGQTGARAALLPQPLGVSVRDQYQNPIIGAQVLWSMTAGAGSLAEGSSATDANGLATNRVTVGNSPGQFNVNAGVGSLMATFDVTVTGAADLYRVDKQGDQQTAAPGAPVRGILVHVRDMTMFGNVAGHPVEFAVTAGGGTLTGADTLTNSIGLASAGTWTLGPSSGINRLTATIAGYGVVEFIAFASLESPTISIDLSTNGTLFGGDSLSVAANVLSDFTLSSVTARVGADSVPLAFSNGLWRGTLPLADIPTGPSYVTITARDINGSVEERSFGFVRSYPPGLNINSPPDGSIVRSNFPLSVTCTGNGGAPCLSIEVRVTKTRNGVYHQRLTGTAAVSGTIFTENFVGGVMWLTFDAFDGARWVRVTRTVYVEPSLRLSPIATLDGTARAYSNGVVVYGDSATHMSMRNIATGATQRIDGGAARGFYNISAYVTPSGAIYSLAKPGYDSVFEWRNGSLVKHGKLFTLQAAGAYAITHSGYTQPLIRYDLTQGTSVQIADSTGGVALAPNGDVVFTYFWPDRRQSGIYRYRNGVISRLPVQDTTLTHAWPVTDGINVVYGKGTDIVLHDGATEHVIGAAVAPYVGAVEGNYAVNQGWTAFTRPDPVVGTLQIWTRSPAGEFRQVSFHPTSCRVVGIGSDGSVVYVNGTRRYTVAPGGTRQDLMAATHGEVVWGGDAFYVLLGSSVLAITP